MIGIAGIARAGKDTLASDLSEIIKADMGIDVRVFSFANKLKEQLDDFLKQNYNISAFTEKTEEKNIIRDLLVCHGETMKSIHGNTIWANLVIDSIKESKEKFFPIIPDVRFDFEVDAVKNENGQVVHISKIGNKPPNEIEAKNDPVVATASDIRHSWPPYEPDEMHECKAHAEIIWQILKETHLDIWKKIYI